MPNRQEAIQQNLKRYTGEKPCVRCGGYERWTRNSGCVGCGGLREKQYMDATGRENERKKLLAAPGEQRLTPRQMAILAGEKIYISSTPCGRCGKQEKYVSSMSCVSCLVESGLRKLNNPELMAPYRTREKKRATTQQWRSDNKETARLLSRVSHCRSTLRKLKRDDNWYVETLRKQDGKCAICKRPAEECRTKSGFRLFIDHCHSSGAVRGLLCHRCNAGIGLMQDSTEILLSAIDYLKEHRVK